MPRRCWAPAERAALCDLLDAVGPDLDLDLTTLSGGRSTGDLAAHLVARERGRAPRRPFPALVHRIRRGGLLPREGRLGESLHLLTFTVHRRDVLRAIPASTVDDDPDRDAAVFDQLRAHTARLGRPVPTGTGLLVRSPAHGTIDVRRGPAILVVDGPPVELARWLFGRAAAADVTVERHSGPADLRERVESALGQSSKAASMPAAVPSAPPRR